MNNVCHNKLFQLLIDKGLRKMKFVRLCGLSNLILAKLF